LCWCGWRDTGLGLANRADYADEECAFVARISDFVQAQANKLASMAGLINAMNAELLQNDEL
jgi:hypothetical protein